METLRYYKMSNLFHMPTQSRTCLLGNRGSDLINYELYLLSCIGEMDGK